jgi:SAM-dependent methyltransferase
MDSTFRALLACPQCEGMLGEALECAACGARYDAPDAIPALRVAGDARTERVREFYAVAPFPGYPDHVTRDWLRSRAERSRFARMLDAAIPADARILEMGCGTGQMSLYLGHGDRLVVGADLCRESLALATAAARSLGSQALFVETDLAHPGLRNGAFDVVYCSGVVHHTPAPRAAFASVARLLRPGGIMFLGLYNAFARLPHRARRVAARISGEHWIPVDPVLAERRGEPARRQAWLRDQYRHPEEHRHTVGEVRRWFAENGIAYVRSFPSAMLGDGEAGLTDPQPGGWWFEEWLAQLGWMRSLAAEGGLFMAIGRRMQNPPAMAGH